MFNVPLCSTDHRLTDCRFYNICRIVVRRIVVRQIAVVPFQGLDILHDLSTIPWISEARITLKAMALVEDFLIENIKNRTFSLQIFRLY
jgi:hypothetical protein